MKIRGVLAFIYIGIMVLVMTVVADATETKNISNPPIVIALDPGHGGEENGAYYYGRKEKDVNYRIAQMLKAELSKYSNVDIMLTRGADEQVGLQERVIRAANGNADLYVSLHLNASVSHKSNGATIYVTTANAYRKQMCDLADYLLGEFEAIGLNNNGTIARVTQMGGRRPDGTFDDYYGVLRHATNYGMPSVLIEHCFMDAEMDLRYLEDDGLHKLVKADANGIAAYLGLVRADGTRNSGRHAKVYGATSRGVELHQFEAPNIKNIKVLSYNGKTPGIAAYEVEIETQGVIGSLYLVYKNDAGQSFTVSALSQEVLNTGKHQIQVYIPANLISGQYQLCFIGASNDAGYDAGYNYGNGEMVGFGKCDWLNTFPYHGEADLIVNEEDSISTAQGRWLQYQTQSVERERRKRVPGILYPN
ncbi:MAG: N-acetylmuramoyl-L-alanine amidase [Eubacteriales bacterium]|nr:N-acetylmuramoyl-L-alanine amidase [Eubacteriales bacterium]